MPNLYEQADRFREQVVARERAASDAMVTAYGQAWQRISADLERLTAAIEAEIEAGRTPSLDWLLQQDRLQNLLRDAEEEIREFARTAEDLVVNQQAQAVEAAQAHAAAIVESRRPAGVDTSFKRLPKQALNDLVGFLSDGTPLRKLFDEFGPSASEKIRKELITGVATGKNPRAIAPRIREELGGDLDRARLISRTEVLRSYRESSQRGYRENADVVEGWVWLASLSNRTCAMCIAMHGKRFPLEMRFGSHPNCRCCPAPLPEGDDLEIETGPEWFARQKEDVQKEILGPGKLEAYKGGKLQLEDLVGYRDDPKWGPTRWERNREAAEKAAEQRAAAEKAAKSAGPVIAGGTRSAKSPEPLEGNVFPSVGPGPKVQPITHALRLPRGANFERWERTVKSIGTVHKVGRLPQIEVLPEAGTDREGGYSHVGMLWPRWIKINTDRPQQELTLTHEVGHYLDHMLFGAGDWGSSSNPDLEEWRDAVYNSETYAQLQRGLSGTVTVTVRGVPIEIPVLKEAAEDLLEPQELWARSYAQWIARKSGDPELLRQVAETIAPKGGVNPLLPEHWGDEEFAPIEATFDRLFERF